MKEFIIKKEKGIRLDKFILNNCDVNQTFLFKMERLKMVRVNDIHPINYKVILNENDKVKIYISDELFKNKTICKLPFSIIYEDENILIVDKPKKMSTHLENDNHNNLLDIVTKYLISKDEYIPSIKDSFKPQVSNRLDYNTLGLVIISKNEDTLKEINKLIENRDIKKYYKVIVKDPFTKKEGLLTDYLIKNDELGLVKISKSNVNNSLIIKTKYKEVDSYNDLSLLEIELITGRTHQIRAHMAFYNHPVLGDNKYGNKAFNNKYKKQNQELLSYKLVFPKEIKGKLKYLENKEFISKYNLDLSNFKI